MINWLKEQFRESNSEEAWDNTHISANQQAQMLKCCSKDLGRQLIIQRQIRLNDMLRKLGLYEKTDCRGNKVLSSIDGCNKTLSKSKVNALVERLSKHKMTDV